MDLSLFLIAFFLPLFPFSVGFNALFTQVTHPLLRFALIAAWPLIGVYLFSVLKPEVPDWVVTWALATAAFYTFRMLAMREVAVWTGFMLTALAAVLWLPLQSGDANTLQYAAVLAAPLAVLTLFIAVLEKHYGAAYTELYGGIALTVPKLSGVFVLTLLAATATPIFPGFFVLLNILIQSQPMNAVFLAFIWGFWSWAGIRVIQGMIVGEATEEAKDDLASPWVWLFAAAAIAFVAFGITLAGAL